MPPWNRPDEWKAMGPVISGCTQWSLIHLWTGMKDRPESDNVGISRSWDSGRKFWIPRKRFPALLVTQVLSELGALARMKFRVFGGEDAPDWVLSGIYTLSKLSSADFQLLTLEILRQILGEAFDYEKALEVASASASLDIKACIAALHFLITSAARFDVDDVTVSKEAQQLGLPAEHTDSFCVVYKESKDRLLSRLSGQTPRIPPICITGWQVHKPSNDILLRLTQPCENNNKDEDKNTDMNLSYVKLTTLLTELKSARTLMENLSN
ncbi:COMM domain-containing protein 4 isoform X1 [Selaginella moellendorffii]|nr:COMM domain-containing protein 4 isoform X1 [Selaginella moellendorffii]XP_024543011.1 COMM domain-containing protein 4 isoform X1 [Selaginella moellendorffii]XP_024543012.1 COMM domain-containing protein 4 isoform X1 [Selaginella moellendorffii]XP_024543013.1 COMM domain-containing protein 4 isoform X1 [Selaginella moellendorffii]|eukprot:XP_002982150.2 COMM domain-containing protein 4 isoform X1 [Selaginella moellendorffii]